MSTTITIQRAGVGVDEVIEALAGELDGRYAIERGGKPDGFTVKGGPLTTAHVQIRPDGAETSVVVSGGGGILISQRLRNNRGIAQDVAAALERSALLNRP
jgi:methylaspartate ammonia-lyase